MEECEKFINLRRESRHWGGNYSNLNDCAKNKIRGGHSNINEKQDGNSNIHDEQDDREEKKWAINGSSTPLTEAQEKLLAHGPNYAVVPKHPPVIEVITSFEKTCQKLVKGEAEELWGKVKAILRKMQPPDLTSHQKNIKQWLNLEEITPR